MLPQLQFLIFFVALFLESPINHNVAGLKDFLFFIFLGIFLKINILEVEIGKNRPGILGVKLTE
jgi:hypothetical protein